MQRARIIMMFALSIALIWLAGDAARKGAAAMPLTLISDSFVADGEIPAIHTCEDEDLSPHLKWSGAPEGTWSFTLIVDDPDAPDPRAPRMTWVHWVLYNLPAGTEELASGVDPGDLPGRGPAGLERLAARHLWRTLSPYRSASVLPQALCS